jgi:hypothetical protein
MGFFLGPSYLDSLLRIDLLSGQNIWYGLPSKAYGWKFAGFCFWADTLMEVSYGDQCQVVGAVWSVLWRVRRFLRHRR